MCKCKTLKNSPFYKCYPTLHQIEPIEPPKKGTPPRSPQKKPLLSPPRETPPQSPRGGRKERAPL